MNKHRRIYLQYKEEPNDLVTVTFRSPKSLEKFLKNKKCNPVYISYKRPKGSIGSKSQLEILSTLEYVDQILQMGGDTKI